VWLQQALGAGSSKPVRILSNYGSVKDFYLAGKESWLLEGYFTRKEIYKLSSYSAADAQLLVSYCEDIGQNILTPESEEYPGQLTQIPNPPCALYVKGELPDFSSCLSVSIVGTRKATEAGKTAARSFAFGLAKQGVIVVSGGALGIDTAAHSGALQAGGKTVCVLGCGIDANYLMANAPLREAIAAKGALLSEYPPSTQAMGSNFPIRNRIISGLSAGTLVVEAAAKSGSLITADCALDQGKDVFAVPSGIYNPVGKGVNSLIKSGAKPVSSVNDILEEYTEQYPGKFNLDDTQINVIIKGSNTETAPAPEASLEGLSDDAKRLFPFMTDEPEHVSKLCKLSGLRIAQALSAVTELEIAGKVKSYPGSRYSI
jgi:DNA processing protein